MKKRVWQCLMPLFFFLIFLPFSSSIDLFLARLCFTTSLQDNHFVENAFTHFIYHYGECPAFALCSLSALILLLSFFIPYFKKWRRAAFFLVFTFVVGAGFLVNGVLKEYIERPRPKQLKEFGGSYEFRSVYNPLFIKKQNPEAQKSFPSGHVTTGAYFFTLIFLGNRLKKRSLYLGGLFISLIWTGALIYARVAQGAHFLSDTLVSVLLMWMIALFFDWLIWETRVFSSLKITSEKV